MDTSTRNQAGRAAETKSFYAMFSDFLRKYRVAVIGVFAALVIAGAAIAIIAAVNDATAMASSARAEKLLEDYSSYASESDEAKKAELEASIKATMINANP